MARQELRCSRCGNVIKTDSKAKEVVSCGHCNLKMKIDDNSQKKYRLIRYLFMLMVCIILAFGMGMVAKSNYLVLIVTMSFALLFANYADKLCLNLTDKIFGLTYSEYFPEKIKKEEKERRKEKQKQKNIRKQNRTKGKN